MSDNTVDWDFGHWIVSKHPTIDGLVQITLIHFGDEGASTFETRMRASNALEFAKALTAVAGE